MTPDSPNARFGLIHWRSYIYFSRLAAKRCICCVQLRPTGYEPSGTSSQVPSKLLPCPRAGSFYTFHSQRHNRARLSATVAPLASTSTPLFSNLDILMQTLSFPSQVPIILNILLFAVRRQVSSTFA